nr:MAG TPA: hypothetical protein [Caudoviricetes sp.]
MLKSHSFFFFLSSRLPGAVIPGTIVGQQVETGFESRRPVFRQFKPIPADCLPPGGSLFLYRYKL